MSRILLVGSIAGADRLRRELLRSQPVCWTAATGAHEALTLLRAGPVALAVVRQRLAGVDGRGFFARARRLRPMLRGILLAERANVSSVQKALECGFDDCLAARTCEPEELLASVLASLERHDEWYRRFAACRDFHVGHAERLMAGLAPSHPG